MLLWTNYCKYDNLHNPYDYTIIYYNERQMRWMYFFMTWLNKKPIIALAPMADMTDSPFCRVCREVANTPQPPSRGDFVIFREMVSAEAIVRGSEKTLKMAEFDDIERPIVLQLFGGKVDVIAEAAKILVKANTPLHPPLSGDLCRISGIDVNMGCPVPKIAGKSMAGASLMRDHERAVGIVKALKNANLGLPISVKTRLGWSKNDEILSFAPMLEQAGADAITIHGRTKIQGYSGKADWDMIAKVKKLVSIPVIANGDINSAEDIERCLEVTQADGVMIGRGALGNPWIFQQFQISPRPEARDSKANFKFQIVIDEIKRVVLRHAELHLGRYGVEHGLKTFRKHLLCYFKNIPNAKDLRKELVRVEDLEQLQKILCKV